jgi:hypothetical protein
MWSSTPFPRILGDSIHRDHPTRSSESLLSLLPTYVYPIHRFNEADELVGFFMSGTIYYALCKIFPLDRLDEVDEHDYFGTFG